MEMKPTTTPFLATHKPRYIVFMNLKYRTACFYKLSLIAALLAVALWNCFGSLPESNSLSGAVKEGQHSPATPLGRLFIDAPTAQPIGNGKHDRSSGGFDHEETGLNYRIEATPKISPAELWVRLIEEEKFSVEPAILEGNKIR